MVPRFSRARGRDVNTHQAVSRTIWEVADWRCVLQGSSRLMLFRGADRIADQVTGQPDRIVEYADVWHAAIRDVFAAPAQDAPD